MKTIAGSAADAIPASTVRLSSPSSARLGVVAGLGGIGALVVLGHIEIARSMGGGPQTVISRVSRPRSVGSLPLPCSARCHDGVVRAGFSGRERGSLEQVARHQMRTIAMCPMRAIVDSMESNRLSKRARASRAEQSREDEEIKRSSGRDAALNRIGLAGAVRLPANQRGAASLSTTFCRAQLVS